MSLALPPYGQKKGDLQTHAKLKTAARDDKWPRWLVSFEAWCAMTYYDSNAKDDSGGPRFQKLMHWLLTNGNTLKAVNKVKQQVANLSDNYYVVGKGYGDSWYVGGDLSEMKSNGPAGGSSLKEPHVSNGAGKHTHQGVATGYNTLSGGGGGNVTHEGWSKDQLLEKIAIVSQRPGSKMQFLYQLGLDVNLEGRDGKQCQGGAINNPRTFATWSKPTGEDHEGKGCASMGNRLAAFFGLYYYEGCRSAQVNWTQDVTVEHEGVTKTFSVRMRLPNPAYEHYEGSLWVSEPLNKKDPSYKFSKGLVAGKYRVPSLERPRNPILFEDNFGMWFDRGEKKGGGQVFACRCAPFFGDEKEQPPLRLLLREVSAVFGKERFHEPEDDERGMMVGFMAPSAIWLWPHGPEEGVTVSKPRTRKASDGLPLDVMYHPLPKWINGAPSQKAVRDAAKNSGEFNVWKGGGFASLLKPFIERVPEVRRAYVLRMLKNVESHRVSKPEDLQKDQQATTHSGPSPQQSQFVAAPKKKGRVPKPPKHVSNQQQQDEEAAQEEEEREGEVDDARYGEDEDYDDDDDAQPVDRSTDTVVEYAPVAFASGETVSFAAALDWNGESKNDLLLEERAGVKSAAEAEKLDKAAGVDAVDKKPLEPGARRRARDTGLNAHWYSANYQPWPTKDLYSESKADFKYDEVMDKDEVKKYKDLYGNVSNLFIRSQKLPKRLTDVNVVFGQALKGRKNKLLLDCRLTAFQKGDKDHVELDKAGIETFKRNMQRIVRVYYDESGDLSTKVTWRQKQEGMRNGIWCYDQTKHKQVPLLDPVYKGKASAKDPLRVLPPVFLQSCHTHLKKRDRCVEYGVDLYGGGREPTPDCDDDLMWVKSDMTVREWLQTPWHYQYLPYQPETSNFRDGETYCEGCNRCARPFYEFQYRYEHYWKSEPQTAHWPLKYWHKEGQSVCDAPLPFHDDAFWSTDEVVASVPTPSGVQPIPLPGETSEVNKRMGHGYHNWQTREFLIREDVLRGEMASLEERLERAKKAKRVLKIRKSLDDDYPFTFRHTINHAYDSKRKSVYKPIIQGRLTRDSALVRYGMRNYYLQRATKFGNVCKDCAAVLELAPGLYEKNTRVMATPGILKEARHRDNKHNWWSNLASLKVDGEPFDVEFINTHKGKTDMVKFKKHMDIAYDYLYSRHCNLPTDGEGSVITKMSKPAEIYVQKRWDKPRDGKAERWERMESETVAEATNYLDSLKEQIKANYEKIQKGLTPKPIKIDATGNMAFYDMLHDTQTTMVARHAYRQDPNAHIRKFDPDMMRVEIRNAIVVDDDNKTWNNCLKVRTWQPRTEAQVNSDEKKSAKKGKKKGKDAKTEERQAFQLRREARDYKEVVYYANRGGELGEETEAKGQWRGDGYVLTWDEKKKKWYEPKVKPEEKVPRDGWALQQERAMKQSRFFITYSLHRPVTSELEARYVMEKMADAVRTLFSNDQYLCELLLFGQKLETFKPEDNPARVDTISQKQYVPILKTKKPGKTFYGGKGSNSYIHDTYETHVDSVTVDAGIEIGPTLHHPHFHLLITINHFSYIQLDYYKMKALLEQMFKGLKVGDHDFSDGAFMLKDAGGMPFYTDNENPYIDFRLYPTDNWQDVIAAYVRKNANPGIFESLRTRTGQA